MSNHRNNWTQHYSIPLLFQVTLKSWKFQRICPTMIGQYTLHTCFHTWSWGQRSLKQYCLITWSLIEFGGTTDSHWMNEWISKFEVFVLQLHHRKCIKMVKLEINRVFSKFHGSIILLSAVSPGWICVSPNINAKVSLYITSLLSERISSFFLSRRATEPRVRLFVL